MKTFAAIFRLVSALALSALLSNAAPLGTAFTYQGRLTDGAQPATGIYDLRLTIYDAVTGGGAVGSSLTNAAIPVTNGLFTVSLDFGATSFDGNARWLAIEVRTNGGGAFALLSPRQPLSPAPYAIYAAQAGTAASATTATTANTANAVAAGSVGTAGLTAAVLSNTFWRLGGNSATTPGAQFLGTTDNQPLEFKANGQRALRLEPGTGGLPNVIGGAAVNTVDPGVFGAVIGGGGAPAWPNRVAANNGTIAGGIGHQIDAGANDAAIGGGALNTVESSASDTVISGGRANRIQSGATYAAIGGGVNNTNGPNAIGATIPGGRDNFAGGLASFAAGRRAKALNSGAFVWADYTDADFASTGTNQFLIRASGGVGIGTNNPQSALHVAGTVIGGNFVGGGAGLTSLNAATLTGTISPAQLPGVVVTNNETGVGLSGAFSGNGVGLTNLSVSALGPAGTFSLSAFTLVAAPSVGSDPQSVVAVDVNGDNKVDLVSANYYGYNLTVLTNNGSGEFLPSASLGVGAYVTPISVAASDVNGDAKVDLISAIWNTNLVIIWTNSGSGVFGSNVTLHLGQWPRCVVAADIIGDGKPELITANCFDDSLTILTNNGSGVFGSNATLQVGNYPVHVAAVDVNGDGKRDLVAANLFGNSLTVLTNNGGGGFGSNATLTVGSSPAWVEAVDVTGDGRPDLISANENGSSLTVLTNNGSGRFVFSATLVTGWNPSGIASADLTGDGRLDLVCANHGSDSLTVFTNNGSGVFGSNETIHVGSWPINVLAVDLNGDGKPDLVSANEVDNSLSILFAKPAVSLVGALYLERLSVSNAAHFATDVEFANGFDAYGDLVLHDHDLLLRGDKFHGLGWYGAGKPFTGAPPDGPVLYGYSGGQLGTKSQSATNVALAWNNVGQVGINKPNPATALDVNGTVTATVFAGNGAALTNLGAASLADSSVTSAKIADNTVAAVDLASDTASLAKVTAGKMAITGGLLMLGDNEYLNDRNLYLRSDTFHGLGWYGAGKLFAGQDVNGPALFGNAGGALGSTGGSGQRLALRWNESRTVTMDPEDLNSGSLTGGLTFGALGSGEGIASTRTGSTNLHGLDLFTGYQPRLSIANSGNVGIGTNNPSRRLQVVDADGAGGSIQVGIQVSGATAKRIYFGDADYVTVGEAGADDRLQFRGETFHFEASRGAGNVGIGRLPTANKLEVEGNASKTTATGWLANSDARIKTAIATVTNALGTLACVRPVSFRYTDEYRAAHPTIEDRTYVNVVAQEFQGVFPDAVRSSGEKLADGSDILQVDTYPLTIYSVAAIQELKQQLEAKDAEIKALKRKAAEMDEVKERLAALEHLLNVGR